jgi:hypothetical protein
MLHRRLRYVLLAAGAFAVVAPGAGRVYAQTVKCYFKDCIVFADGSRICEVKEVPCPNES